ncbi:uncharacterized protein AB9X84_003960 [Acanthopagrus schlegelii]
MLQLRSFIQQRLSAAAEEILGEVERTVSLALSGAQLHPPKEERHNETLEPVQQTPATPTPLTDGRVTGQEALQEAATQVESNLSASAAPSSSDTTADAQSNDGSCRFVLLDVQIKEEQEVVISSTEVVTNERGRAETQAPGEVQPVYSDGSGAQNESGSSSGEEWGRSRGAKAKRRKLLKSVRQKDEEVLPDGDASDKNQKDRRVCPVCGKSFQYTHAFMKHIKTHKQATESTMELLGRLQTAHSRPPVCDICSKEFTNLNSLQIHSKTHTGSKDFRCQDCGKSFIQKEHLIVHRRTHSGDRPYRCGKCGQLFYTRGHLKAHMERFSGLKPHGCDVCGKVFCQRRRFVQHRKEHVAGSAE